MARRRLSDLLREEANKSSDDSATAAGAEPSPEAAKEPIAPKATPTKATTAAKSRSTKQTAAPAETKTMTTTKDESLQQKIADLTAALDAQTATTKQLQTELEQMHSLKTELEQVRKEMHELTETNAKLTKELKAAQSQKSGKETSALATTKATSSKELNLAPPPHATAPEDFLASFNRDVGWFD
ncbi:MAG: hypothetical protein ACAF41_25440 [Leptolyngbya sp. BL-A-14]